MKRSVHPLKSRAILLKTSGKIISKWRNFDFSLENACISVCHMVYYTLWFPIGRGIDKQKKPSFKKEGFNEEWELQAGKPWGLTLYLAPLCFSEIAVLSRSFCVFHRKFPPQGRIVV